MHGASSPHIRIRKAGPEDAGPVWEIIRPVFRRGDTYAIDPDISREDALAYWFGADRETFVLEGEEAILGTYYIRPNQLGGGRHVCNCGYITAPAATGRGLARMMCEQSQDQARQRGYKAMQFNFVVSSNVRAVRLWHSLGFETLASLPGAFRHPELGFVDAYVMFKTL